MFTLIDWLVAVLFPQLFGGWWHWNYCIHIEPDMERLCSQARCWRCFCFRRSVLCCSSNSDFERCDLVAAAKADCWPNSLNATVFIAFACQHRFNLFCAKCLLGGDVSGSLFAVDAFPPAAEAP